MRGESGRLAVSDRFNMSKKDILSFRIWQNIVDVQQDVRNPCIFVFHKFYVLHQNARLTLLDIYSVDQRRKFYLDNCTGVIKNNM